VGRIETRFAELKNRDRKAFVAYITAGDPTLDATVRLVKEFDRQEVDIVELGVPFSDPVADGPVNQEAAMRALLNDVSVGDILEAVREIRRDSDIPMIFFAYYNSILAYGPEQFVRDAEAAGIDGALVLDLPLEEAGNYKALMDLAGLATVFLVSPVTPPDRVKIIAESTTGFVYYVSRLGVTGERDTIAGDIPEHVARIKSFTDTPVVVGFGISNPDQVKETAAYADGVVVGSSIVRRIGANGRQHGFEHEIGRYVGTLTRALQGG